MSISPYLLVFLFKNFLNIMLAISMALGFEYVQFHVEAPNREIDDFVLVSLHKSLLIMG